MVTLYRLYRHKTGRFLKKFGPHNIIVLTALFSFQFAYTQSDSLQKQINEQVWKPFISTFNSGDNEGFKAVHSKDVIRVSQDSKQIFGYDQYFKKMPDSIKAKWNKWKRNIELRFIQRIASNGKAFEVGYYKTKSTDTTNGVTRTGYGKFHVLLRKENNTWKILMDEDSNDNTTEAVFQTGKPLE
jgi:ketosteroid isomerase-like protein